MSSSESSYFNLGNTQFRKGQLDDAISSYRLALELNPNDLETQIQLMKVFWRKGLFIPGYYLVNHHYKLIFCRVPKNANSLLTAMMLDISEWRTDYENSGLTFSQYISKYKQNFVMTDWSCLTNKEYFKFAILRNPFKRLVSGYLDRFVKRKINRNVISAIQDVHANLGIENNLEKSITFQQFIDYLVRTNNKNLDLHWRPQSNFLGLGLGLFEFDYLGQFEKLNLVCDLLEKKLDTKIRTQVSNQLHITKYGCFGSDEKFHDLYPDQLRQMDGLPHSSNLYTPELEALVRTRYSEDIEIYEKEFGLSLSIY